MTSRNRLWVIGSVAAMVVILLLAWFIGIQPQLSSLQALQAQQQAIDAQNAREQAVLDQLQADADDADQLEAEWQTASASVPDGTGVPAFINQLYALQTSTGVTIERITVSDAAPFVAAAPAVPVDASGDGTTDGSATDASGTDASAPTGTSTDAAAGAATSTTLDASNFATLQIGIEVSGEYSAILEFVHGLQSGARLMLVNEVEVSTAAIDPNAAAAVYDESGELVAPSEDAAAPSHQARIGGFIFSLVNADEAASTQSDLGADQAAGQ
ncbi:hypothetical protein ATC03_15435 [Agromyces aureus]|uniref:Uncharacterized protein n=2 Tax=Agromyces aureus TaxID=453304 RepID=A0A191WI57_9MICO|nr:hypothetical protein ATC03_15435 [Agromyces aureus]